MKYWLSILVAVLAVGLFTTTQAQATGHVVRNVTVFRSTVYSNNVFGVNSYNFNRVAVVNNYVPVAVANYAPVAVANYGYQAPVSVAVPTCITPQVYQAPVAPVCAPAVTYAPVATYAAPVYTNYSVGVGFNNYFNRNVVVKNVINTSYVTPRIVVANRCR